jgi:hypothetical protein
LGSQRICAPLMVKVLTPANVPTCKPGNLQTFHCSNAST